MREFHRTSRQKGHILFTWAVGLLAFVLLPLVPSQVEAQSTCNSNLQYQTHGPMPYFLGDEITVQAFLAAGSIGNGDYLDIPDIGFAMDCKSMDGLTWESCDPNGHKVTFIGKVETAENCVNPSDQQIKFPGQESSFVELIPLNGPLRIQENESCLISWKFRVDELASPVDTTERIAQVVSFPIDEVGGPAICDNGLPTSQDRAGSVDINTCEIEMEKQICLEGCESEDNWFNADTAGAAPALLLGGNAQYRLVVANTGTAGFVSNIQVTDSLLWNGIRTVPALAAGQQAVITSGQIPELSAQAICQSVGSLENIASVTGSCRAGDFPVSDTFQDNAFVSCQGESGIDIVKKASQENYVAGDTITYTFTVTNVGTLHLTNVTVTDPLPGLSTINCPQTELAAGQIMECTATYTTTQADADAGEVQNTATATGTPPVGPNVQDQDTETITSTAVPAIDIEKSASPETYSELGETIVYTFVVTNTGGVTLDFTEAVQDADVPDNIQCTWPGDPLVLFPTESVTCTVDYLITQEDLDNGTKVNIADTFGKGRLAGRTVTDQDTVTIRSEAAPALGLTKTADPSTYDEVGDVINYSYELENIGPLTLYPPYTVDDDKSTDESCTANAPASLAPGDKHTCTASYTITQADLDEGSVTNVATATAKDGDDNDVTSNQDEETVTAIQDPDLGLIKSAVPSTYDSVGDVIGYSYELTNNGNVTLYAPYTVADDKSTDEDCTAGAPDSLAPGESHTCTASYTITQADLDDGSVTNVAIATAKDGDGGDVTSNQDEETVTADQNPTLGLVKSATPGTYDSVGDVISYSYLLTNIGNVTLYAPYAVDDDKSTDESCADSPPASLAPNDTHTCTASYTITQADLNAGSVTNYATATAEDKDGGTVTSNQDDETVFADAKPSIEITKDIRYMGKNDTEWSGWMAADNEGSAAVAVFDADAQYRLTVKNTGNVDLKNVEVDDPDLPTPIVDYSIGALAVDATEILTEADIDALEVLDRCTGRGTFTNNSTANGESVVDDTPVTDFNAAVLKCIGEPAITIAKDISPTGPTGPWYPDITPAQEFPSSAWYRIVLKNVGTAPLENLEVTDGDLTVVEDIPGTLAVGASVTLDSGTVPELFVETRCDGAGTIGNTASVSGNSVDDPADTVDESDSATLKCVGLPAISISKEISTDNSAFEDADTVGTALVTQAPSDAYYRITINNDGPVGLTNVILNDGTLGITDYDVGDIGVGGSVVLTDTDINALYYPDRCLNPGTFGNTANVQGDSVETGSTTSLASDSAWLECTGTPAIQIFKDISVTGTDPWFPDSTPPQIYPSDAWYRLRVTNTGTTDLTNVVVTDGTLGVNYGPFDLAEGASEVVLTATEITELYQPNRCTSAGSFVNTASVSADSAEFPFGSVGDSDMATLVCEEQVEDPEVCVDESNNNRISKPYWIRVRYDADPDTLIQDSATTPIIIPPYPDPVFPATPVDIFIFDDRGGKRVYLHDEQNVVAGAELYIQDPPKLVPPTTQIEIYSECATTGAAPAPECATNLLQTIEFHTSCSQPLLTGDEYGGITIAGGGHDPL